MKKLVLVRHAKSSWDNPEMNDFDRPLNERGVKNAPRMGKRLKEKGIVPDLMLSSPAVRALVTCQEIAKKLGYADEKIKTDKRIYHASEDQLLAVVKELKDHDKDDEEVVMIFGHNPGLTDFANALLDEDIENIPTCGVIVATLDIDHWKDAHFGCGELDFFDYPKRVEE